MPTRSRTPRPRRKRESAAERRLADVLGAIGEAVFAVDRDQRILFANRKALEWWRRREEDVLGRKLLDSFPEIEHGEPYRAYQRVLATGEALHLETRAPAIGNRWVGLDVYPEPEGGLVVAFRDIDERKEADARLRESDDRFRLMLEAFPAIAFVIGPDGIAEYYNQRFRDYIGGPIGLDVAARRALQHPEDQSRLDAERKAGLAAGGEYTIEARMRRHDGVYRWHRIHNRPIHVDGRIAFWLGTAVDIDDMRLANERLEQRVAERTAELETANRRLADQIEERERAEAQLRHAQRIEAVGQLTSGVAHDFNNLLTAIIGNLELLETRLPRGDERLAKMLAAAQSAAERGARLTAQLLAFSRQQRMASEAIDLNGIVTNMSALLHSTIGATVRIETVLSESLWPAIGDPGQIELVLLNLAINARDAMPVGGAITIETGNATVTARRRPEEPPPGDYAMVSVADRGTGIAPEILDKVFDPFFTTKEVGKGSGLGLSQVLGVAQQLGGGVRIDTTVGEGTILRVYLPRAAAAAAALEEAAPAGDDTPIAGRILLVDDDTEVRAVAAAMLREAGHEIVEAGSAGAALERLDRAGAEISMMIADVVMPGMSGIELARVVHAARPDLPILFITGFAGAEAPLDEAGRDRVLHKPFRAAELTAKVASLLGAAGRRGNVVRLRSWK
mgnify:CR=1 FL=1